MPVQREDIEEELARVLSGAAFANAERARSILEYVVNREVSGDGARIKAYAIATDVLGRSDDFDPASDSIVRVEVARLRQALDLYYATEGTDDPVRIVLERGSYRPAFVVAEKPADRASPRDRLISADLASPYLLLVLLTASAIAGFAAHWALYPARERLAEVELALEMHGPRIIAMPFANITGAPEDDVLAAGLTVDTIAEVARFRWLVVVAGSALPSAGNSGAGAIGKTSPPGDYRIVGQLRRSSDKLAVSAQLEDVRSRTVIWADTFNATLSATDLIHIQREIARAIALAVAPPGGIIGRLEQERSRRDTTASLAAYQCVMRTYVYWRSFSADEHAKLRDCLERAFEADPDYAEGLAALAFVTLDEYRYQYNQREGYDPVERAADYARQAMDVDPLSALAAQASFTIAVYQGDRESFEHIGRAALENNPNDSDLLADYGQKLALTYGDWATGIALIQRAWTLNPNPPAWSYIGPAYHAYVEGRFRAALDLINRAGSNRQVNFLLLRAAVAYRLGDRAETADALAKLKQEGLGSASATDVAIARLLLYPGLHEELERDGEAAFKRDSEAS